VKAIINYKFMAL